MFNLIIDNNSYIELLSLINMISNLFTIKYFNYKLINISLIKYKENKLILIL